jgi:glycosyltransferase involved in cell wall biosynthesis
VKCAVVIPVGPGHEALAERAYDSAMAAWKERIPAWSEMLAGLVLDTQGDLGRSAARNFGICAARDADWYFLLDADDLMDPLAFTHPIPAGAKAMFGQMTFQDTNRDGIADDMENANVYGWGKNWRCLMANGARWTLSMGAFFHGPSLRAHLFREDLDYGEDWEFYLSFLAKHDWAKLDVPLAHIGNQHPSAGGPRGKPHLPGWRLADVRFIDYWRKRGRVPLTDEERMTDYWKSNKQ